MKGRLFCSLLVTFLSIHVEAQYAGPESVEYEPAGDRYFVSNTQNSSIKELAQNGSVSDFVASTPNAPYGLEILGDTLYACMGNGVRGYSLATGDEVYFRNIGAQFPNGITTDGTFLYVTAFQGQQIIKVDPAIDEHSVLVTDTDGQPNGIVFDPQADRLVVVFWGSNAPIKAYDRISGEEEVLIANSGLGNIDGITIDCNGNFITASWSAGGKITRWDPAFTAGTDLNVTGLGNPADIDFDDTNDVIAIPNSSLNTVTLHGVDCSTGMAPIAEMLLTVIPNPVKDIVHVQPAFNKLEPYIILDGRGLLIGGGTLRPNGMIDLGRLAAGTYILQFTQAGRQVKLIKE